MSNAITLHIVRAGSVGVRIPPSSEKHMVVEYGTKLESPLLVGTAYLHDWPEEEAECRWIDEVLRPRMNSRLNIVSKPPSMPNVPHLRYAGVV